MKKPGGTKWKKWQHGFLCSQYYLGYFKCILQDYSKKYYNISFPYINRWTIIPVTKPTAAVILPASADLSDSSLSRWTRANTLGSSGQFRCRTLLSWRRVHRIKITYELLVRPASPCAFRPPGPWSVGRLAAMTCY